MRDSLGQWTVVLLAAGVILVAWSFLGDAPPPLPGDLVAFPAD